MTKTREEFDELLKSHKEAVKYWSLSLEDPQKSLTKVQSAKVSKPLDELLKLSRLIKAHTTKVGIIFKPENIAKDFNPAFSTLQKLSESLVFFISVLAQLQPSVISHLYYNEIIEKVKELLDSNSKFADELISIFEKDSESESPEQYSGSEVKEIKNNDEVDRRLVSVGKIWSNCDSLSSLIQKGALDLLTSKIKVNVSLIEDGYEEFVEWTKNPEEFDDDPFGFSDDESDNEDEDDKDKEPPVVKGEDSEEEKLHKDELIKYSQFWSKKIDLVKLLLASFKKSLPVTTTGQSIDLINGSQYNLVTLIDKFIVDLMMDRTIDDEIKEYTDEITKESKRLVKIARDIHAKNDKRAKWYSAWETKYTSDL
ncbi:uncharacterized protein RJT20DRAFT_40084 [Scheffersomyces xylosifermentans]|uniref:uncharacterized protein n=1 Tax=Scheffersomyces xylosifermentans TaxID=1304137 RepID=UPI00315D22EC